MTARRATVSRNSAGTLSSQMGFVAYLARFVDRVIMAGSFHNEVVRKREQATRRSARRASGSAPALNGLGCGSGTRGCEDGA